MSNSGFDYVPQGRNYGEYEVMVPVERYARNSCGCNKCKKGRGRQRHGGKRTAKRSTEDQLLEDNGQKVSKKMRKIHKLRLH